MPPPAASPHVAATASLSARAFTGRVPGLDGLRALAVVAVLLFHAGVDALPGGFLGVDLFFVLSGFLITTLLLREHHLSGRLDLVAFWLRRARRLLPALLLVIMAVWAFTTMVLPGSDQAGLRADGLSALFSVANWHLLGGGQDYFAQYADPSLLMHTWSLSIEEQFYWLWPAAVLLLLRTRRPVRAVGWLAACGAALSAIDMAVLSLRGADSGRLYYGTDTRIQAILVGAALAALLFLPGRRGSSPRTRTVAAAPVPRVLATVVALLGLASCLAAVTRWGSDQPGLYAGGISWFAVSSALLIAAVVVHPTGVVTRCLERRPLRAIGEVSYGIYLWHWPVFQALDHERTGLAGPGLLLARLALTGGLAAASYRFVEQPIRRLRPHRRHTLALPLAYGTAAAVLVACTAPATSHQPRATDSVTTASALTASPTAASPTTATPGTALPTTSHRPSSTQRGPFTVTFLGDSTALTLAQGLRGFAPRGVTVVNDATLGCGVTTTASYRYFGSLRKRSAKCFSWRDSWRSAVKTSSPAVVAILVGRWEVMDQSVGGHWTHIGNADCDASLLAQLEQAYEAAASTGAKVAFLSAPYYHRGERPDGGQWPEDDPARVDAFNGLLAQVVAAHPGHAVLLPFGARTAGGGHTYVQSVDGVTLRYDGVHFTTAAARWLSPWLFASLAAVR